MSISQMPDIVRPLGDWYAENRRILPWREDPTPYHVWVSEIMLQQTRVEAVIGYYKRFLDALPTIQDLASCKEEELLKLWEGLGYYNRVRNMQKCAILLCENCQGRLPDSPAELKKLPGIGEYTSGAIASIAFGHTVSAIDGNALRIFARLRMDERDIAKTATKKQVGAEWEAILKKYSRNTEGARKDFSCNAEGTLKDYGCNREGALTNIYRSAEDRYRAGNLNQALMDLGATVCLPNGAPACGRCPVRSFCRAREAGRIFDFPLKSGGKARKIEDRTILIVRSKDTGPSFYAIEKRPDTGLLAGFYQFPNLEGQLTEEQAIRVCEEHGTVPLHIEKLPPAKHVFSHIEWHMTAYEIQLAPFDAAGTVHEVSGRPPEGKLDKALPEDAHETLSGLRKRKRNTNEDSGQDSPWLFQSIDNIHRDYPIPSAYAAYMKLLDDRE